MKPASRRAAARTFLRSFLIQGSWNYHTMLGTGFGFALLPSLRWIFGDDEEGMKAAVSRHVEHFNAHPYLSNVALGAVLTLEEEGEDPETIRRFKVAVRGPLGAVGDALVWASWLPLVSMAAVAAFRLGLSGGWVVLGFLVLYNLGHLLLRVWGFHAGRRAGRAVGRTLERARFPRWTELFRGIGALVLGVLAGAVLVGRGGLAEAGAAWGAAAVAAFVVGLVAGQRVWRPAAVVVVALVALLSTLGFMG